MKPLFIEVVDLHTQSAVIVSVGAIESVRDVRSHEHAAVPPITRIRTKSGEEIWTGTPFRDVLAAMSPTQANAA